MKRLLKALIILSLPLLFNHGYAQSCFDQIADVSIPDTPYDLEKESAEKIEFLNNVNCFLGAELDTIDIEIMTQNSYLEVILVFEQAFSEDSMTYRKLKGLFTDFVYDPSYDKIRKLHLMTRGFTLRTAIYANWETDRIMLIDMGIPEENFEPFAKYLEKHPNTGKTYQELMEDFEESKATKLPDNEK